MKIMPNLGMKGSFPLTKEEIDKQIPEKVIGNYAYENINKNNEGIKIHDLKYVKKVEKLEHREHSRIKR